MGNISRPERGYPHDPISLWIDLYYFLSIFGASQNLLRFKKGNHDFFFDKIRRLEYSKSARRLVSIAAIVRNTLDVFGSENTISVGRLFINDSKKSQNISLKEACNKILHADGIEYVRSTSQSDNPLDKHNPFSGYIKPLIILSGKHKQDKWVVELDVYKFAEAAFDCL